MLQNLLPKEQSPELDIALPLLPHHPVPPGGCPRPSLSSRSPGAHLGAGHTVGQHLAQSSLLVSQSSAGARVPNPRLLQLYELV